MILQNEEVNPLSCNHSVFGQGNSVFGDRILQNVLLFHDAYFYVLQVCMPTCSPSTESLKYFTFQKLKAVEFDLKIQENNCFCLFLACNVKFLYIMIQGINLSLFKLILKVPKSLVVHCSITYGDECFTTWQ